MRKLQLRIAKATRQQQWRQVRELQRILTRSFSGKAVAVRRVTENTGKGHPVLTEKYGTHRRRNGKEYAA
ncbi:reverse transcriptase N-terminal domain-containing protein (plasmid) [Escherichia coli]|nr:reverse transcriptase N-terminal domain-containing protein [Escherichia coli]